MLRGMEVETRNTRKTLLETYTKQIRAGEGAVYQIMYFKGLFSWPASRGMFLGLSDCICLPCYLFLLSKSEVSACIISAGDKLSICRSI